MHRITISNGLEVVEDAQSFVLIMQHISAGEATIEELEKLDILRFRLYNAIISPVLDYIEGYGTVYIAPDNELINLPFDLLYNEDKTRLADWHNCVKIECARDFLFGTTDTPSNKGTLIVSDPEYEVRERIVEPDRKTLDGNERQRALNLDIDKLNSLPFSKVEAYRISSRIGGELYTGVGATKQVVLSAKGYENIHIATHGYFDIDNEYASLYSSCLVFTGIKNWYRTGRINPIYGSGVLTADEVSRMDLSSTNLVVLSSCLSGMNASLFGTSEALLSSAYIHEWLVNRNNYILQLLFYGGWIAVVGLIVFMALFLVLLIQLLGLKNFKIHRHQLIYTASFSILAIRTIMGTLYSFAILPYPVVLPFGGTNSIITDSIIFTLILYGAWENFKYEQLITYEIVSPYIFLTKEKKYNIFVDEDEDYQEEGVFDRVLVKDAGDGIICDVEWTYDNDREVAVFIPLNNPNHQVFMLEHTKEGEWHPVKDQSIYSSVMRKFIHYRLPDCMEVDDEDYTGH